MATYVMSDIHGMYDKYKEILDIISFSDSDVLYILGDVIDRGTQSIEVLQDMMMYHNIIPLIGNHEYMALQCLDILTLEITEESLDLDKSEAFFEFTWSPELAYYVNDDLELITQKEWLEKQVSEEESSDEIDTE